MMMNSKNANATCQTCTTGSKIMSKMSSLDDRSRLEARAKTMHPNFTVTFVDAMVNVGDCFYDAAAFLLNSLKKQKSKLNGKLNGKRLRSACADVLDKHRGDAELVKLAKAAAALWQAPPVDSDSIIDEIVARIRNGEWADELITGTLFPKATDYGVAILSSDGFEYDRPAAAGGLTDGPGRLLPPAQPARTPAGPQCSLV